MLCVALLAMLLLQPSDLAEAVNKTPSLQARLQAKVDEYAISEETFLQALLRLAAQFEIPLGVEWVRPSKPDGEIDLVFTGETVREILCSVVRSQPGYTFRVEGSIVHVFPEGALVDRGSFLNLSIRKFELENEFGAYASHKLHNIVQTIVSPPDWPPGSGVAGSIASGEEDRRISLTLENATVRDILDAIASATHMNVWVVAYPEKTTLTPKGFYRTLSVGGEIVPDDYQPVWVLFRWGYDPIRKEFRSDWRKAATARPRPLHRDGGHRSGGCRRGAR